MCKGLFVCHGDKTKEFEDAYTDDQKSAAPTDTKLATYYLTRDGKYAIDSDYVDLDDLDNLDLDKVPKIALK